MHRATHDHNGCQLPCAAGCDEAVVRPLLEFVRRGWASERSCSNWGFVTGVPLIFKIIGHWFGWGKKADLC